MQPERVQRRQRRQILVAGLGIGAEHGVPAVGAVADQREAEARRERDREDPHDKAGGIAAAAQQRHRGDRRDCDNRKADQCVCIDMRIPEREERRQRGAETSPGRPVDQPEADGDEPDYSQDDRGPGPGSLVHPLDFSISSQLAASGSSSIDVVLPVLDEARPSPCSGGISCPVPSPRRGQRVERRLGCDGGRARRAVVSEPRRGFGAACLAGSTPRPDIVCFMDCDGSFDPSELRGRGARRVGQADLVLGARVACGARGRPCAGRATAARLMVRRRTGLDARHRPDAGGAARRAARARSARPPLRLAARDGSRAPPPD